MSGFDLPPIQGFDRSFKPVQPQEPERPFVSPELGGDELPVPLPERESAGSFGNVLFDSLDQVRNLQLDAKEKVQGMVMGEDIALHDVMIAGKKSEVAFNLVLEVRNKLVEAWDKLSRSAV